MRSPPREVPFLSPNSESHTRPSSSTTIPLALLADSAAFLVGNARKCQYTEASRKCSPVAAPTLKQPNSGRFSPGGTSTQATSVKCSCAALPGA